MILAFAYVRASTQEEVRQGSNERQKVIITEYAKSKGYELEFFEDRAKSGKNIQRPDFERMLNSLDAMIEKRVSWWHKIAEIKQG